MLFSANHQVEFVGSGDGRRLRVPLRRLQLVCLYGAVRLTAGAVRLITDAGASLAYFSTGGQRFNGSLHPPAGNLRAHRYRQFLAMQNPDWMLDRGREVVAEKIDSQLAGMVHLWRHARVEDGQGLRDGLQGVRQQIGQAATADQLRGLEGTASRIWYQILAQVLPNGWSLPGRVKRPPTDPVNALLSLGYTLLYQRTGAACEAWGLDSCLGVFHEYRSGRASLACDLVESFRVPCVDRLVLRLLGQQVLTPGHFESPDPERGVRLTPDGLRIWLAEFETHLHGAPEGAASLQVQLVERVRRLTEQLPVAELSVTTEDTELP